MMGAPELDAVLQVGSVFIERARQEAQQSKYCCVRQVKGLI